MGGRKQVIDIAHHVQGACNVNYVFHFQACDVFGSRKWYRPGNEATEIPRGIYDRNLVKLHLWMENHGCKSVIVYQ